MKEVWCNIQSLDNQGKKGIMFICPSNYSFENLVTWVYRNCKGSNEIKITSEDKPILAIYDDRVEGYYFKLSKPKIGDKI